MRDICMDDTFMIQEKQEPGGHISIKMLSYQYRDPHVKDKKVSRPSYL